MIEKECVTYYEDGTIEIFGTEHGTPEITAVVPSPDCNTKSEKERKKRFEEACNAITLQGYFIKSKRMKKNAAFDDPGQKTTLEIVYRPCKTKGECNTVHTSICKILLQMYGELETNCKRDIIIDNPDFFEVD